MKNIRRSYIVDAEGSRLKQKSLAFAMLLKERLGSKSYLKEYSINKLRQLARCSASTAKKYITVLINMGIVTFEGKDGKTMVIRRLCSGTKHRNVSVEGLCFDTFKDAFRSLQSLIFMLRQAAKDFIRRLIRVSNSPKKGENCQKAKKLCKKYAWQNPETAKYEYREWGFSFAKISEYIGCCSATAQRIIKYAIGKKWILKKHMRQIQQFLYRVCSVPVEGYDYTTKNNGYKALANRYALSAAWEDRLAPAQAWHLIK